jgi:hypothetical protein
MIALLMLLMVLKHYVKDRSDFVVSDSSGRIRILLSDLSGGLLHPPDPQMNKTYITVHKNCEVHTMFVGEN